MFSKLSFLSPLFLTARDLEIHIKILVVSLVTMSALDDFSSLPTGTLVNPAESYNAIQSYMRKQNKILYNQKNPNTATFLFLIIMKYFVMFFGHLPGSAEYFFCPAQILTMGCQTMAQSICSALWAVPFYLW